MLTFRSGLTISPRGEVGGPPLCPHSGVFTQAQRVLGRGLLRIRRVTEHGGEPRRQPVGVGIYDNSRSKNGGNHASHDAAQLRSAGEACPGPDAKNAPGNQQRAKQSEENPVAKGHRRLAVGLTIRRSPASRVAARQVHRHVGRRICTAALSGATPRPATSATATRRQIRCTTPSGEGVRHPTAGRTQYSTVRNDGSADEPLTVF